MIMKKNYETKVQLYLSNSDELKKHYNKEMRRELKMDTGNLSNNKKIES